MQKIILSVSVLLLAGCASTFSVDRDELSEARAAIESARAAGAEQCAPDELSDAQAALYQAAHEFSEGNIHAEEQSDLVAKAKKRAADARATCKKPEIISLPGVHFEFDSAKLTSDSIGILDGAVRTLKKHSTIKAEVAAHTDSMGSDSYNYNLSGLRAKTVLDYLVAHGIAANRLKPKGYGESMPIADNGTDKGRAMNRRVELRILSK